MDDMIRAGMSRCRLLRVAATVAFSKHGGNEMFRTRACPTSNLVVVFIAVLRLALPASADGLVPLKARADAVITGVAPAPDGLHLAVAGEGNATHLGRFTLEEHAIIHADGTVQATVVWTAADGDQLFYSDMARFTSPTTAAGTLTFTGGTGRFTNASGTADFEAVVAADGIHLALTYEGTIQF